jgi:protein ImuA
VSLPLPSPLPLFALDDMPRAPSSTAVGVAVDRLQAPPFFMASPESLHPALWRASQLGAGRAAVTRSGFEPLDAVLPGGGWPHRVLTELLLPHPGLGELRLLAPALAALAGVMGESADPRDAAEVHRARAGDAPARHSVMLFDPPAALCGWALGQIGIDVRHWLVVRGRDTLARPALVMNQHSRPANPDVRPRKPEWDSRLRRLGPGADVLWALEQSLQSGHLGAAMAWLPAGCKADALRRLQLAAQAHDGPVFVFRETEARNRPSVAPLRLLLAPAGLDALSVRVLKRRGPPLAEPLRLELPPVLSEPVRQREHQRDHQLEQEREQAAGAGPAAAVPASALDAGARVAAAVPRSQGSGTRR